MREHDDELGVRRIFLGTEPASQQRFDAENREHVMRRDGTPQLLRLIGPGESRSPSAEGKHAVENLVLLAPVKKIVRRRPFGGGPIDTSPCVVLPDHDELIRRVVRKRPKQHAVDDAENRGRGTDTERQSKGSHHRRTGFVEQQTKTVADIGYQGLHNAPFCSKRDARRRILANYGEKG